MAVLTVTLNKVTNLADEDVIGKTDPYVKFELEQDVSHLSELFHFVIWID
jgi:Ca2+-dependent lipid-binding protein